MSSEASACRLCLTTEGSMEGIFTSADTELTKKIFECTSVQVKNLAGLPSFICEICKSELIIWLKFRRQCLKANEFLKTKFPDLFEETHKYKTFKRKRAVASDEVESTERINSQEDANEGDVIDGDANDASASESDDNIPLLQVKEEPCQVYEEVHYVTLEQSDESGAEERTISMEIEPQPLEKENETQPVKKENVGKRPLARISTVADGVAQKRKNKNGELSFVRTETMSSGGVCYKCNRPGHFARDCQNTNGVGRDMRRSAGGGSGGEGVGSREKCYKCNKFGHFARMCNESAERCYRCNGIGHIASFCNLSADEQSCYICNRTGHLARNCFYQYGSCNISCFNCNKSGHISRNCPNNGKLCYVCGRMGHISRECGLNTHRN